MRAQIRRLILKRFRSVLEAQIDLDNPLFLVGQNGSGKSNVADAFAFLAEAMAAPLKSVFDNRGGISNVRNRTSVSGFPPNLGVAVEFGPLGEDILAGRYAFEVAAERDYGFRVKREQCVLNTRTTTRYFDRDEKKGFQTSATGLAPALEPVSLCLPLVGGDARFAPIFRALSSMRVYAIDPQKLRNLQEPDIGESLRRDGSNAASVLDEITKQSSDDATEIGEVLSTMVPNTVKISPVRLANKLSFKFEQGWGENKKLSFDAFSMSDGTLRALGLLLAVYQRQTPALMVIEEPESTIHPGALGAILDLIHIASKKTQVVITTHSPDLLDAAKWIEERHLRVVSWHEGATYISPIPEASRKALKNHLMGAGELLRSNVIRSPSPPELFEGHPGQMKIFLDHHGA